jgi:hypothetical protein
MNPNLESILKWLDSVGAKLGQLGAQTFTYMVRHTFASAVSDLMAAGVIALVLWGAAAWVFHIRKDEKADPEVPHGAIAITLLLAGALIFTFTMASELPDILAPEGATIKGILTH